MSFPLSPSPWASSCRARRVFGGERVRFGVFGEFLTNRLVFQITTGHEISWEVVDKEPVEPVEAKVVLDKEGLESCLFGSFVCAVCGSGSVSVRGKRGGRGMGGTRRKVDIKPSTS